MALGNVRPSLGRIAASLEKTQQSREFLIKNTREIVVLCGRAIISVHRGDLAAARRGRDSAGVLLKKYRRRAAGDLARYLVTPEQEFVEASALIAVAEGGRIPSERTLGVSPESYVLGLLDCIGELKRMTYDRIRTGDTAGAAAVFAVMEDLYLDLYAFAAYDKVVKEARRKTDVARMLVEDARAAVTEESRRADLIRAIGGLEGRAQTGGEGPSKT